MRIRIGHSDAAYIYYIINITTINNVDDIQTLRLFCRRHTTHGSRVTGMSYASTSLQQLYVSADCGGMIISFSFSYDRDSWRFGGTL